MKRERVIELVRDVLLALASKGEPFTIPSGTLPESIKLVDLGITSGSADQFTREMLTRFGIPINFKFMLDNQAAAEAVIPSIETYTRLSHLVDHVVGSLSFRIKAPQVVYIDDEEENLFVFRRWFGGKINLRTFDTPIQAIDYILATPDVVLVLTDEVMPGLSGNQLRDQVHAKKPFLKFILITGNPEHDENLMYQSLRGDRFFDFFAKPLDFNRDGERYLGIIKKVLEGDFF